MHTLCGRALTRTHERAYVLQLRAYTRARAPVLRTRVRTRVHAHTAAVRRHVQQLCRDTRVHTHSPCMHTPPPPQISLPVPVSPACPRVPRPVHAWGPPGLRGGEWGGVCARTRVCARGGCAYARTVLAGCACERGGARARVRALSVHVLVWARAPQGCSHRCACTAFARSVCVCGGVCARCVGVCRRAHRSGVRVRAVFGGARGF